MPVYDTVKKVSGDRCTSLSVLASPKEISGNGVRTGPGSPRGQGSGFLGGSLMNGVSKAKMVAGGRNHLNLRQTGIAGFSKVGEHTGPVFVH